MGLIINVLLSVSLLVGLGACTKDSPADPTANPLEGTSSGGGSFGDESSTVLLNWAKTLTADTLRRANPAIFKTLPKGWTQNRLADLVENVRAEPKTVVYRYGRELMFDYRSPKGGGEPYLIATSLYFRAHASIPVNSLYDSRREPYVREIRTKLLHEAAHVLGFGLSEKTDMKARGLAIWINYAMFRNNIVCKTDDVPDDYPGKVTDVKFQLNVLAKLNLKPTDEATDDAKELIEKHKQWPYYWIINRPTALGLQAWKSPALTEGQAEHWLLPLLEGKPRYFSNFIFFPQQHADQKNLQQVFEPKRSFTFPAFLNNEHDRVVQQYYKKWKLEEGRLTLTGEEIVRPADPEEKRECTLSETISFPVTNKGNKQGRATYYDNCHFGKPAAELGNSPPISGSMEVECVESLVELGNLEQFMDNQPFTSRELIHWEKNRGSFD